MFALGGHCRGVTADEEIKLIPVKLSKHIIWFVPTGVAMLLYIGMPRHQHETEQISLPADNGQAPAMNKIEASTNDPLAFNPNQPPQGSPDATLLPDKPASRISAGQDPAAAIVADEPVPTLVLDTNTFDPDSIRVSPGRGPGNLRVTLRGRSSEELEWMRHHVHRVFLNGRLITDGFTTYRDIQGNNRQIILVFENLEKAEEIAAEMRAMKQKTINDPGPE
jgi:hypothetical protein